jgi:predicted transposase YbfD/YdcC
MMRNLAVRMNERELLNWNVIKGKFCIENVADWMKNVRNNEHISNWRNDVFLGKFRHSEQEWCVSEFGLWEYAM